MSAVYGNIYEFDVDAIVCGAYADLVMDGGIAAEIKQVGGREIEDEAITLGPADIGTAVVTGAGSLKTRNVIHAVVGKRGETASIEDIGKSVASAINAADELDMVKMAIPAVGVAMAGAPVGEVVNLIIELVLAHESKNIEEVIFIVCQRDPYMLFKRGVKRAQKGRGH